jgi:hypothetical protein
MRLGPIAFAGLGLLLAPLAAIVPAPAQSLVVQPASANVAPGQQVTFTVSGADGVIAATVSAGGITVSVDPGANTVTVSAQSLGPAGVHISDAAGDALDVPVQVLPPAGTVPARLHLTLTGEPAAPDFLSARIGTALADAVRPSLALGSSVRIGTILPPPQALASGFLTNYAVAVTLEPGAGTAPVAGTTAIEVENAGLPAVRPTILSFRDDPERITADGVLSRTTVDVAHPTRLYYYHENMGERRRFVVAFSANDSVRTRVQVIEAAAGPNADVMSVGHAVTRTFLTRAPRAEGDVLTIAGGRPMLERDTLVGPGEGIVGALDVRVLDGGPVTVTVLAIPPDALPADYLYGPKLPDDGHTRHGAFDLSGFAQDVIAYSAGGPDARYEYGNRRRTPENLDPSDPGRDFGDYGVLQNVRFDLDNPSTAATTLYLYEKPLGGDVRSSFLVNGTLVDVGCVRVPNHYLIATTELAPHAVGVFDVVTMTDGGSNYPLEIGVSATPPLPQAPAISAADGCFPKPGGPPAAAQPAAGPTGQ